MVYTFTIVHGYKLDFVLHILCRILDIGKILVLNFVCWH